MKVKKYNIAHHSAEVEGRLIFEGNLPVFKGTVIKFLILVELKIFKLLLTGSKLLLPTLTLSQSLPLKPQKLVSGDFLVVVVLIVIIDFLDCRGVTLTTQQGMLLVFNTVEALGQTQRNVPSAMKDCPVIFCLFALLAFLPAAFLLPSSSSSSGSSLSSSSEKGPPSSESSLAKGSS